MDLADHPGLPALRLRWARINEKESARGSLELPRCLEQCLSDDARQRRAARQVDHHLVGSKQLVFGTLHQIIDLVGATEGIGHDEWNEFAGETCLLCGRSHRVARRLRAYHDASPDLETRCAEGVEEH